MTPQIDSSYVAPAGTMVVQGSASVLLASFYKDAISLALPFIIPAFILIVVDLVFGCAAARRRGETVRASRAIRRTMDKLISYTCWVVLSATLSVAFDMPALNKVILGIVMGVELMSVVTNYFAMRGKKVTGIWEAAMKILGKKIDADLSDVKIEDQENISQNN